MGTTAIDLLLGRLVSFVENEVALVGGARDEVNKIKAELEIMKSFLEDAEIRGARSEVEKTWVTTVRNIAVEVESIVDDFTYHMNMQQSSNRFKQIVCTPKHFWMKHRISKNLQKINTRIREIPERNQRYGVDRLEGTGSHDNRVKIHGESSLFKRDDLVGIVDAEHKLVGWLLNGQPQRTVISVVGMAGSGKTTIVASTFNSETVKRHFDCHAWITVSQTYTINDLLRTMIEEFYRVARKDMPSDLGSISYRGLMEILVNYLQSRRYVVILDDVWNINLWSEISGALPERLKGSRVMLTTRKEDIAVFSFGVESHVHRVEPLKESDAWDLFCSKAFSRRSTRSCPQELKSIAKVLVQKCKGLPLGIVALGALMSTKLLESEWRRMYNSLNWELSNNPMLEFAKSILLLSFKDLPCRLKHCFLYCCIFPEDYVIQREKLLRLWIAEGFIDQVRGVTLEERAESYLMELVCRSMLQVVEKDSRGRIKACKMHDLLRELALSISEAEKFCAVFTGQEATEESNVRRLSLHTRNVDLQSYKGLSGVCSFFVFLPRMASSSLNALPLGFKMLKVLDLEECPIVELPDKLAYCFNLRYLNLSRTKIKKLPKSIGKLHKLQTLDIRRTEIKVLPSWIGKLENLRNLIMYRYKGRLHLGFEFVYGMQTPSDICTLKNLQVLDCVEVGGAIIKGLKNMTQLTRLGLTKVREADENDLCISIKRMTVLQFLSVMTGDEDEVLHMGELSSAPPLLETVILAGKLERVPNWFHTLQSLTRLELHWSRLREDVLPCIQSLPYLSDLLLVNAYQGNQLCFLAGFQKLSYLGLDLFPQLNGIIIEKGVMPCLQKLEIGRCMELNSLPRGIEHLSSLQELNLACIPVELIERICEQGSVDRHKVRHISKVNHYYRTQSRWFHETLS